MLWTVEHASRTPLQEQIAACVRRGIVDGQLAVGDRLPPAQELADAVGVDRNTVLAAYRQLRDAGVLDFHYTATWPTMSEVERWWLAATGGVGPSPSLAPASLAFAALLLLLASIRLPVRAAPDVRPASTRRTRYD